MVVTAMVSAQILHYVLDELEGTSYYKQNLKQVTKRFQETLTRDCDDVIRAMYDADEVAMNNLQDDIQLVAKSIATMDPKDMLQVKEFIQTLSKK